MKRQRRGARGMGWFGHLKYRDRKGVWQETSTFYSRVFINGERDQVALGEDEDYAWKRHLERVALASSGRATRGRLVVADILDIVEAEWKRNRPKSAKTIPRRRRHLEAFFGDMPVSEVEMDTIAKYQVHRLDQKAAPATIEAEVGVLSRGFTLAEKSKRIAHKPFIPHLRVENARKGFFERADFVQIVSVAERRYPQYAGLFWVVYLTGARPLTEVATREWRHVDFRDGVIRFEEGETKNGEGREFPMYGELRTVLERQRQFVDEMEQRLDRVIPWVFPRGTRGNRITEYGEVWDICRREAGQPNQILYNSRRTVVRNLEKMRVPRSIGMAMTGHKTEAVYRRYAISDRASIEDAGERLQQLQEAEASQPAKVAPFRNRS